MTTRNVSLAKMGLVVARPQNGVGPVVAVLPKPRDLLGPKGMVLLPRPMPKRFLATQSLEVISPLDLRKPIAALQRQRIRMLLVASLRRPAR